jgi:hypothetical protein
MRHHCHIREGYRSRPRVTKIKHPRGQAEVFRQGLDWAGTPAGQHGA